MKNIFITGRPGCGKTTLIKKLASFYGKKCGGFYTQEVRTGRERVGFDIISLSGERGQLARKTYRSKFVVGKYGVNLGELERVGLAALKEALDKKSVIVVDEIGKMELFSEAFRNMVMEVVGSRRKVLGVITREKNEFIGSLKSHPKSLTMELKENNFELLYNEITNIWRKI